MLMESSVFVAKKLRTEIQEEALWLPGGLLMSSILTLCP